MPARPRVTLDGNEAVASVASPGERGDRHLPDHSREHDGGALRRVSDREAREPLWGNARGEHVGLLRVRLFRPFSIPDFARALPPTVRSLAVLDRTKEPGPASEPLYQDVLTALREAQDEGFGSLRTDASRHRRVMLAFLQRIHARYGAGSLQQNGAFKRGTLMPEKDYPAYRQQLRGLMGRLSRELPGPVSAFGQLHTDAMADGALSTKTKELIALGIAIAVRCEGCLAYHVHNCLEAGAARQEILETIGVAIAMGGGPSSAYGCGALQALEQYAAKRGE